MYFKDPLRDPTHDYASSYYALYIVQNEAKVTEKRETNNLFAVLSELGGLIEILAVGFGLIVASYQSFCFYQRLIKELLLEEGEEEREENYKIKRKITQDFKEQSDNFVLGMLKKKF